MLLFYRQRCEALAIFHVAGNSSAGLEMELHTLTNGTAYSTGARVSRRLRFAAHKSRRARGWCYTPKNRTHRFSQLPFRGLHLIRGFLNVFCFHACWLLGVLLSTSWLLPLVRKVGQRAHRPSQTVTRCCCCRAVPWTQATPQTHYGS